MTIKLPGDPRELDACLRALAAEPPGPASRAAFHDALHAGREDRRVIAIRAMARWGDRDTAEAIKRSFVELARKDAGGSAVWAIAFILAWRLDASDIDWVLDVRFNQSAGRHRGFKLDPLFRNLPPDLAEAAIRRRAPLDRDARLALHAIARVRGDPVAIQSTFEDI